MAHLKRILLSLCAMFVIMSAAPAQTDPENPQTWLTYAVKGEEFGVALPGPPAISPARTYNRPLKKSLSGRLINTTSGKIIYTVEFYENVEAKLTLDQFVADETAGSRFDVMTGKKLTVDGVDGKEFSSLSKSSPAMVQFFATERRLYRFAVTGADANHAGVQQFFSSIRLGQQVGGIEVSDDPYVIDGERIFTRTEVDEKVKFLVRPNPQYTQAARQKGITGTVVIKAICSATGRVTNIIVVRGLPQGLTEQAMAAVKAVKFTPAMKDGKPVSMWMQFEYNFSLY